MPIERSDLPSGLTVVTEVVPGARSASFGCWVRVGSRDEPDDLAGASHFLEHLLFKGSAQHTGREISEAIDAHEIELGIPATDPLTRPLDLLANMVLDAFPTLRPTLVEKGR